MQHTIKQVSTVTEQPTFRELQEIQSSPEKNILEEMEDQWHNDIKAIKLRANSQHEKENKAYY